MVIYSYVQVKVFCIIVVSRGGAVVALECSYSKKAMLRVYRECAIVLSGIE